MSIFQVRLNNSATVGTGYVTDPSFKSYTFPYGGTSQPSTGGGTPQRSMDVTGPNLTRRRLYDGMTFTSTNYWKRYASTNQGGLLSSSDAFIYVVNDDGSPYSDKDKAINKMAVVWNNGGVAIAAGSTQTSGNAFIDFMGTYGGAATYVQIMASGVIKVSINSPTGTSATMDVVGANSATPGYVGSSTEPNYGYAVQIFDNYDLPISNLTLWAPNSWISDPPAGVFVEVVATVEIISHD